MIAATLLAAAGLLLPPSWGKDGRGAPQVALERRAGSYQVSGEFRAGAPAALAWAVLADYEGIPAFVSSIRESRVLERAPGRSVVRQEASGRIGLFSRTLRLRLEVVEQDGASLAFRDLSGADFETYAGEWRVEAEGAACRVFYRLEAEPGFLAPPFLAGPAFRKNAEELLEAVRREIERRALTLRTER